MGLALTLLLLFPIAPACWEMAAAMSPGLAERWPLTSVLFEAWDAGAQQPLGRAILRCLCAALGLAGLFLPARTSWGRPGWFAFGTVFLGLGAVSSLLCPHRFQALREWEIWALAGVCAYTVAAQWQTRWGPALLGAVYGLTAVALLHAVTLGMAGSTERLGGLLHHANALSTFCLMLLPIPVARMLAGVNDRVLAQLAAGSLLGLALCAGSLTGSALLGGMGAALVLPRLTSPTTRAAVGLAAAAALVAANLAGGWLALLSLPALLALLWVLAAAFTRREQGWLGASWLAVVTVGLVLLVNSVLAPAGSFGHATAARTSSGLGRLEFYQSTLSMVLEHPLLGCGPGGFAREYPSRQTSISYFSKFPHSLPLELASEWGLPALLVLALLLVGAARAANGPEQRVAGWVVLVFLLHSCTDVQTQFPYLLVLAALALGVMATSSEAGPRQSESRCTMLARTALAMGCLGLLVLNLGRLSASYDRALAMAIAKKARIPAARAVVDSLLCTSFLHDPLDSEAARLWGLSLLSMGRHEAALSIAEHAVRLDPHRASCELLRLTARPPAAGEAVRSYRRAVGLDRVNYPIFYRGWAEGLWAQGQAQEALQLLRDQASVYAPSRLAALFSFREDDLADQLVEFHALKAMLEAQARPGHPEVAEPDLRLALLHCEGRPARVARLQAYLESEPSGRSAQSSLPDLLQLLLEQVPGQQAPATVQGPPRQP